MKNKKSPIVRAYFAALVAVLLCYSGANAAAPIFRIKAMLDKGQVLIDGGAAMGLEAGDVLFVHNDNENKGRVTVSRVTDTEAYATITDETRPGAVEIGNLVEFEPIREKVIDSSTRPIAPGVPLSSPVREAETLIMGARYSPSKLQEIDEKIRSLKQQLNLGGKDPRLFVELGEAYLLKNEIESAINWLKQGVALDDKSDYVPRGLYRIAQAYVLSGRNDRAVRYLNFLTANYPASAYNKTLNQAAREAREMFEVYSLDQALLEPETRLQRSDPSSFATSGMTRKSLPPTEEVARVEKVVEEAICPAKVNAYAGTVEVQLEGSTEFKAVKMDDCLFGGDKIKTGNDAAVVLRLKAGDVLALHENAAATLEGLKRKDDAIRDVGGVVLDEGQLWADVAADAGAFRVTTPTGVVNVRGTKFLTQFVKNAKGVLELQVFVVEGKVEVVETGGASKEIMEGQWLGLPDGKIGAVTEFDTFAFGTWLDSWYGKLSPGTVLDSVQATDFTYFPKAAGSKGKSGGSVPTDQESYLKLLELAGRPSLMGLGGLDSTPTAVIRPGFAFKADMSNGDYQPKGSAVSGELDQTTFAINYGGNGNFELGAYKTDGEQTVGVPGLALGADYDTTGFGVKFLTKAKVGGGPRYGMALTYATTTAQVSVLDASGSVVVGSADNNQTTGWAFARWGRSRSIFNLGMFYTDDDTGNNDDDIGFFLNYAQLVGDKGLGFLEFLTKDSGDSLNLGFRYGLSDAFTLEAVARDVLDGEQKSYGIGIGYAFGGPRARATLAEVEGLTK